MIVTQCHLRFGLAVTRGLLSVGRPVVAAGSGKSGMCAGLEGVVGEVKCPDPFEHPLEYARELREAAERFGAVAVLPAHEDSFVVARYRAELEPEVTVLAPRFRSLVSAQDKGRLADRGCPAGVPVPETRCVFTPDEAARAIDEIGLPIVVKRRFGSGAHALVTLHTWRDLERKQRALRRALMAPCVVQRWVAGRAVCVGGLVVRGRVRALAGHLRLRELPRRGGASTARLTFRVPALELAASRLLEVAGIEGVGMVEFRFDPITQRFHAIEMNPRYWGGLACAIASGVNFPALHVATALGGVIDEGVVVPDRIVESRWALGEAAWAMSSIAALHPGGLGDMRGDGVTDVTYEDLPSGRIRPLWREGLAHAESFLRHGNFGGHGRAKARFFADAHERSIHVTRGGAA